MANKYIMPRSNKYEIRTDEVQEIMRKPPHAFVLTGNLFTFLMLGLAFYFLNIFSIYEKETIHFEIKETLPAVRLAEYGRVSLLMNSAISKDVLKGQAGELYISDTTVSRKGFLSIVIDSIGYTRYKAPVLYVRYEQLGVLLQDGMIGYLEINKKKKSFLSTLVSRFKK